jgi:hypothetical protein
MADTYPVHCRQAANGDLQFYNPTTGNAVLTFSVAAGGLPVEPVVDGLTAHAGGGQANGLLLTSQNSRITTVGTAGDSVVLPPAVAGLSVTVCNGAAANAMNVYPASAAQGGVTGGDAINALGVNAAFSLAANKVMQLTCYTTGQWYSILTA